MKKTPWTREETLKLFQLRKAGKTISEIAKILNRSWDSIYCKLKNISEEYLRKESEEKEEKKIELTDDVLAEELSRRGYIVEKMTDDKADREWVIYQKIEREFSFGIISCTHLGSKYQQLTHLKEFYQRCYDSGVFIIFHCGDMVDGCDVYDGQEYEIFCHGLDAQVDYAIEHYPQHEGMKTYVIAGNHDYSFVKKAGADPLEKISRLRQDIVYLGAYGAYPIVYPGAYGAYQKIGYLRIYLHHGHGGNAYARSYRLQKNIEQFAPEAKPDYYFLGHYHTTCIIPHYRNVLGISVPCFQSQTPFLRRHGLNPEVGGLIIKLSLNDEGRENNLVLAGIDYIPFYRMKEKDY